MSSSSPRVSLLGSIGPAIIVASVVLGPGSILTASKVGWQHGASLAWVLGVTCVLMCGMTALSARLGVCLKGSLCDELAEEAGRPWAVVAGGTLFLVVACFQFSNNLGVLFGLEPLLERLGWKDSSQAAAAILVGVNLAVIVALYGFRRLYRPVELLMKLLVAAMIVGFAANLVWSLIAWRQGWLEFKSAASTTGGGFDLLVVVALIGTTFSVGGAFYQSYLVRQKGWTRGHLKQGLVDSVAGIATLGLLTLMIMLTAALVLHGNPNVEKLESAADVARQLQPLFGVAATWLFSLGIFAGAFSSFLVNAMIGGAVFSDGLGMGSSMDGRWPKLFTVLALLSGMGVALAVKTAEVSTANLIIFAQALTVLGNPLLAGTMLYLAIRANRKHPGTVPPWLLLLAVAGFLLVMALAVYTPIKLAS